MIKNGRNTWKRRTVLGTAAMLLLAIIAPTPTWAQAGSYAVTDLGRLQGTDSSYPLAINTGDRDNPKVVGNTVRSGLKDRPFYWSKTTGLVDLGLLGAGSYGEALSVNSKGQVVGHSATSSNANNHAFYWSPQRGARNMLDLAPGWPVSHAYQINEAGVIFGYVYSQERGRVPAYWVPSGSGYSAPILLPLPADTAKTGSGPGSGRFLTAGSDIAFELPRVNGFRRPVLWKNLSGDPANPSYGLPTDVALPAGATSGGANLHTENGLIGGGWDNGGYVADTATNTAVDVGSLSGTGGTQLWALSQSGLATGQGSLSTPQGTRLRAVVYLPEADPANSLSAGLSDLGTLGGTQSRAYGISFNGWGYSANDQDQVVGWSYIRGDKETHAFLWDRRNRMRDLNSTTLTPSKGPFAYLRDGACISNEGFITGSGVLSRGKWVQAYLLTPQ